MRKQVLLIQSKRLEWKVFAEYCKTAIMLLINDELWSYDCQVLPVVFFSISDILTVFQYKFHSSTDVLIVCSGAEYRIRLQVRVCFFLQIYLTVYGVA